MATTNYCTTVLFVALVGYGGSVVGQPKGERKQGEAKEQVTVSQTPIPSVQSVSEQPKAGNTTSEAQRPTQITIEDSRSGLAEWIGIVINALLLAFVGYQANANRKQLILMREEITQNKADGERHERGVKAAEEEAKITKEAFYVGENPYFGIEGIGLRLPFSSKANLVLEVTIFNGGHTPAWHFEGLWLLVFGDRPDSPEGEAVSLNHSTASYADRFVASGGRRSISYWNKERYLTEAEIAAILEGTLTVFAVGTAHYTNMRKERLHHDFTAIWDNKSGRFLDWEA